MALTPEQIEALSSKYVADIFQSMEQDVISDIARRIRKTGRYTETAEIMAKNMSNAGFSPSEIRAEVLRQMNANMDYQMEISRNTMAYKKVVEERIQKAISEAQEANDELVAYAGTMSYNNDLSLWQEAHKELHNTALPQIVDATKRQTWGEFQNITRTTALAIRDSSGTPVNIMDAYHRYLDKATMELATGTFSYDTVVNNVIREMSKSGIRYVEYNSKGRMTLTELDVAVRRNVRTGLSQMAGRIMEKNLENSDTDLVITSQHMGSRPEHAVWQNKIFSYSGKDKRYPDFRQGTGYGTVTGLKGANCTHNFYPYWRGISVKEPDVKEPKPVTVNGRQYNYYQATQKQRAYERDIRALKREISIQENSGGDAETIKNLKRQLRTKSSEYKSFSNAVNISDKPNRTRIIGINGKSSDLVDRNIMPKLPKETAPEPKVYVTAQEASDDWFEYEKANFMSEYIRTGYAPTEDIYGNIITQKEISKLKKEAELIQEIGEKTNTKYNTLYRGMVLNPDEARSLTPGDMYKFPTLSATSPSRDIAMIYTNTENSFIEGGTPVILEIQKSGGINGFKRDSAEVVLPKGAEFKITRNYMDENGIIHISLYASKKKK